MRAVMAASTALILVSENKEKPMNQSSPKSTPLSVAIVRARWHAEIVDECTKAFDAELGRLTN